MEEVAGSGAATTLEATAVDAFFLLVVAVMVVAFYWSIMC